MQSFIYLFLIGGQLLYNIVLVSATHPHESALGIQKSPPSWISLPPHPTPLGFKIRCMMPPHTTAQGLRADLPQVPDGQLLLGAGFVDVKGKLEVLGQGSWRSLDHRGQGRPESMRGNMQHQRLLKSWLLESKSGTLGDRAPEDSREHHGMYNPSITFMLSVLHTEMVMIFLKRSSDFQLPAWNSSWAL